MEKIFKPEDFDKPSKPDSKKSRTWLWILLAAFVMVGVVVAIVLSKDSKTDENNSNLPTDQVEQTMDTPEEVTAEEETNVSSEAETSEETATESVPDQTVTPVQLEQSKPQTPSNTNTSTNRGALSSDLEENAKAVIRGDFGNGQERKEALGNSYTEIQNRVNEIYRERYNK